jgi:hypothetical protein
LKRDKNLIGAAGEHLVLSRLLQQGILSSLSPFNAYKADILINPVDGREASFIQVKTTTKNKSEWNVSAKDMTHTDKNMFYCFVLLNSSPQRIYVIPAKKVSEVLTDADRAYLKKPMKDGSKRKNHNYRLIKNSFIVKIKSAPDGWMDKYLEKWDLLE